MLDVFEEKGVLLSIGAFAKQTACIVHNSIKTAQLGIEEPVLHVWIPV